MSNIRLLVEIYLERRVILEGIEVSESILKLIYEKSYDNAFLLLLAIEYPDAEREDKVQEEQA